MPPQYHVWIRLNPIAPLIGAWQGLFLDGALNGSLVLGAYAYGVACLAVGSVLYHALSPRFAELV